jgi:hypothetical protein
MESPFSCMVCERETNGFPLHCSFCDQKLDKPGALLISPPQKGSHRGAMQVVKMHVCSRCYEDLNVVQQGEARVLKREMLRGLRYEFWIITVVAATSLLITHLSGGMLIQPFLAWPLLLVASCSGTIVTIQSRRLRPKKL